MLTTTPGPTYGALTMFDPTPSETGDGRTVKPDGETSLVVHPSAGRGCPIGCAKPSHCEGCDHCDPTTRAREAHIRGLGPNEVLSARWCNDCVRMIDAGKSDHFDFVVSRAARTCHICSARPITMLLDCPDEFHLSPACDVCGMKAIAAFEAKGYQLATHARRYAMTYGIGRVIDGPDQPDPRLRAQAGHHA